MSSNPFYFKTRLVNWFHALFGLVSLLMVMYNIIYRKEGRLDKLNYTSMMITAVLAIPLVVDNVYDVAISYDPAKFSLAALITILVAMILMFILGAIYARYISKQCVSTYECKLANGYSRLATNTTRKMKKIADFKRSHFFVNVVVFANVLMGLVVFSGIMTAQYTLRIVSMEDKNTIREMDALYSTLVLLGMHLVFLVFDVLFRKGLWGLNFSHHLILGIYILSNLIELHYKQRILESVTVLSFLCVSIPLFVISLVYTLMGRLSLFINLGDEKDSEETNALIVESEKTE